MNFSSLSRSCSWPMFPGEQILGGEFAPANSVEGCQSVCEATAGCVSLDFVRDVKECWLLKTQEGRQSNPEVDHYDHVCVGQYWIYIYIYNLFIFKYAQTYIYVNIYQRVRIWTNVTSDWPYRTILVLFLHSISLFVWNIGIQLQCRVELV